jgi:U3 small nucleolar RNA-associated protein 4
MAAKASATKKANPEKTNSIASGDEVGMPIDETPGKRSARKMRKRSNSESTPSTKNEAVTPEPPRARRSKSVSAGGDKKKSLKARKEASAKKSSSKKKKNVVEVEDEKEEVTKEVEVQADDTPKKRRRKKSNAEEETLVDAPMIEAAMDDAPVKEPEEGEAPAQVTKPPPTLNVKVHRMRHLNFTPKAILCMAATPHDEKGCNYVAVSRKGGSVELKSPDEKYRTVAQIAGMSDKTVDCMAWICGSCDAEDAGMEQTSFSSDFHKSLTHVHAQRTLIGAGKDGTLFVVDFSRGGCTTITGSGGGGVFSLVSLCNSQKCCSSGSCPGLVAAGCEDGSMRIYKLNRGTSSSEAARLDLVSTVPSTGASVLSMAWIRSQGITSSNGMDGTVLYAGVADGTIRRYECKSAVSQARSKGTIVNDKSDNESYGKHTWSSKIRMTVESYGRTMATRVWKLLALSDGTVISSDSLGHVQFWDGKTGTLLQSFEQNDKKADVLALAITPNECQVFASGIDSRVICIERSTIPPQGGGPVRWIMTYAQRPHTHDVKALAVVRVHSQSGSLVPAKEAPLMLCSGGVDTKICSFRIQEFKSGRPKTFFPWPTISPISVAPKGRVLLMRREDTIELHQLGPKETGDESLPLVMEEENRFIGTMDIQSSHNLVCSDISPDGKYVAASTGSTLLLFEMEYLENEDGSLGFTPSQISLDDASKSPCLAVKFSPTGSLVCAQANGTVRLLKITESEDGGDDDEEVDKDEAKATSVSSLQISDSSALFAVHSIAVSEDGKFFATVRSGAGSGTVTVFAVKDETIHKFWSVSALEAPVSSVSFLPGSPQLAVACTNYAMYVFDLKERKLSDWSEKSGFPVTPSLPFELNRPLDFPTRIISNPKTPEKFLVVSDHIVMMVGAMQKLLFLHV